MFNKKKKKTDEVPKVKKNLSQILYENLKVIAVAFVLAFLIKSTIVGAYMIPTPSMESTLMAGDYILGNRFIYGSEIPFTGIRLPAISQPKHGDMIIFTPPHDPKENYVKRCVGLPGDTIQLINKRLYVNGEMVEDAEHSQHISKQIIPINYPLSDPYIKAFEQFGVSNDGHRPFTPFRDNSYEIVVPENKYFMMGDNRDNSLDSRMWGFADRDQIKGKVMIVLWSWNVDDKNAPEVNWKKPLTVASNLAYNTLHFPERFRWNRILHIPH
jgi:signal peptidase I